MTFEADFLDLMLPGVQVKPFISMDTFGARTFGTTITIPGHVRYVRKSIRASADEVIIATATVQIPPPGYIINGVTVPLVANESEVILPDESIPRHVLEARVLTDDTGSHHQTLHLA